jgi:chromosome partitioning protein
MSMAGGSLADTSRTWYRYPVAHRVIGVVGLKGGVGKTLVSATIAATLASLGKRVLGIDSDPQGSFRAWGARGAEGKQAGTPVVVALDGKALSRGLQSFVRDADYVVIDSSRLGADARFAMSVSSVVLAPTTPGVSDFDALRTTLECVEQAVHEGAKFRAFIVLNRADPRTMLTRMAVETIGGLPLPLIGTLGARVAFGEAMLHGTGPSSGTAAADEATTLTTAVLTALGETSHGKQTSRKK